MIVIPRWDEEPGDTVLAALTESLLEHMRSFKHTDVRLLSKEITESMQRRLSRQRAPQEANPEEIAIEVDSDSGKVEEDVEMVAMGIEQTREALKRHSAFADVEMVKA